MAQSGCVEAQYINMNWDFVAHSIRDVFFGKTPILVYGNDLSVLDSFRSSVHALETFVVHSEKNDKKMNKMYSYFWDIGEGNLFFNNNFCDLFLSIEYDPIINHEKYHEIFLSLKNVLKKNGFIILVNPGSWAKRIGDYFEYREDMSNELKRYFMFKEKNVFIYENV